MHELDSINPRVIKLAPGTHHEGNVHVSLAFHSSTGKRSGTRGSIETLTTRIHMQRQSRNPQGTIRRQQGTTQIRRTPKKEFCKAKLPTRIANAPTRKYGNRQNANKEIGKSPTRQQGIMQISNTPTRIYAIRPTSQQGNMRFGQQANKAYSRRKQRFIDTPLLP